MTGSPSMRSQAAARLKHLCTITPPGQSLSGFDGQEHNRFFERTADGVNQVDDHMVQAGTGVAMLPDDLHSIHIDGPALNFHCYGLALERLDEREYYNPTEDKWKIFSSVSGIREGRTDLQSC